MTKEKHDTVIPTDEFQAAFKGKFHGALQKPHLYLVGRLANYRRLTY